jgi:methionyl-tRNA formyltransferase
MRIIFAGTPDFAATALRSIVKQHDIVAVLTQPDRKAGRGKKLHSSAVKLEALSQGLDVLQPERLKPLASQLSALQADAMVVVAYGMLIPQLILDIPRYGCLNIHASLLPRWRGAAPIQRAIEAGDDITGVSIMQMEAGLDTGPVLTRLTTPIESDDTSATLHERLAKLGAQGINSVLQDLESDSGKTPKVQNHDLSTYAHKLEKSEANIDWQQAASVLEQRIRAFNPWPICQTYWRNERLRIWRASWSNTESTDQPNTNAGQIIELSDQQITVQCGYGRLHIEQLQKDGGKVLDVRSFCNGFELTIGDSFESHTN